MEARHEPIGLIAGWGRLPELFTQKAHALGIPVICVGIRGMAERDKLAPYCARFYWSRFAALNRPIRCFQRHQVRRWTMAGKIFKVKLFEAGRWLTLLPDWRMVRFYFFCKRRDNADDTLTLALIDEFAREGLTCTSALELCPELLVRAGVLTRRSPTSREEADIDYGWHLAKEMGRLDVGQSVIVRERAVLAVEAIEGTDAAIRRAGDLSPGGGFVVVKVAKPQQDMRFDVPTVGPSTIASIKAAGGRVLAIEAARTILIDEADTIRLANEAGIALVAR